MNSAFASRAREAGIASILLQLRTCQLTGAPGDAATFLLPSFIVICVLSHFLSTVVVCQMTNCCFSKRATEPLQTPKKWH